MFAPVHSQPVLMSSVSLLPVVYVERSGPAASGTKSRMKIAVLKSPGSVVFGVGASGSAGTSNRLSQERAPSAATLPSSSKAPS